MSSDHPTQPFGEKVDGRIRAQSEVVLVYDPFETQGSFLQAELSILITFDEDNRRLLRAHVISNGNNCC